MSLGILRRSICGLCVACSLIVPAMAAGTYTDVPEGSWYAEAVEEMAQQEILTGVTATLFCPTAPVTRATVVTSLWRMEGSPDVSNDSGFTDVPPDQWYTQAVNWAAQEKIVSGDGKGNFLPDDPVTREQLAVFFITTHSIWGKRPPKGYWISFPMPPRYTAGLRREWHTQWVPD